IRDFEIIETEMMLADLESIQKRLEKNNKKNVNEDQLKLLETALDCINNNKDIQILYEKFNHKIVSQSGLLSIKPKIFVCNVDEQSVAKGNKYTINFIKKFGEKSTIIISADIENQINQLENKEKENYMGMIGLKETGLNLLIKKGYNILNLETYFTSGQEESRAWTIQKNSTAPQAAGEIHSDFEKGFIRAETIAFKDFIENQGWTKAKTAGKMRLEGKDYIVKDGDVLNFRFNT
ncbi:DUF933 domain-containing protein, partial [Candidatus Pelagibacter sp.]|nr:DUF933 domain-containing protein [Candidatus Pelagibacter sp.]